MLEKRMQKQRQNRNELQKKKQEKSARQDWQKRKPSSSPRKIRKNKSKVPA